MDEQLNNLPPVQGPFSNDDESAGEAISSQGRLTPPFNIPRGPPAEWNAALMINHIKVGMMIKLSTIPLYLYSMYSVKPTNKDSLRTCTTLRGVLQQEMLHLALVGNLLSALGGSLDLYDHRVVPKYPGTILMDNIPMKLKVLNTESLGYFIQIEGPEYTPPPPHAPINVVPNYRSIGAFYEEVIKGVRGLPDEDFANNMDNQFTGNNFFGDQLFAITNRNTALQALRMIIEQGEGNARVKDSHHDVFTQLHNNIDALEVHRVPNDPKTADYIANRYIHNLSLASDTAYCYLLQTIQQVWDKEVKTPRCLLFRNIHAIMSNVLTPLAEILVQQTWGEGVTAPCFNYYQITENLPHPPLPPDELHTQLCNIMTDAADATSDAPQKLTLERIGCYIDKNIKPSS